MIRKTERTIPLVGLVLVTLLFFGVLIVRIPRTWVYQNGVDGYALSVPGTMEPDDTLSSICTRFETEHISLTVYAQPCQTEEDKAVYVSYSNRFLENEQDFTVEQQEILQMGTYSVQLNRWSRKALSRLSQDKRHYACFDIDGGTPYIYTLFFKFDDSVDYAREILSIARSFRTCAITQEPEDICLGLETATGLGAEAQGAYERYFSEDASLTWGLYSHYAVYEHRVIDELEERLDFNFPVYLLYSHFGETPYLNGESVYDALCIACPENQLPELTLQTVDDQQGNMLLRTLDGEFDTFLHSYAAQVAQYEKPVLFRLANEMNGDWCVYCAFHYGRDADLYVAFYRYIFDIFQQEGADNAIWVWNPNYRSFPDFKWNHELMYYPGDAYVHVVGLTAYNTGSYYEGESWNTFDELYEELYQTAVERYAQPLMITEFASSSVGGDKPGWITDMFQQIRNYPRIKVVVWWNGCDMDNSGETPVPARPYYLDETEETTQAFAQGLDSMP